ncbi:MAG: hypothetical protein Q8K21_17285 [Hydrogenophaga sp.]|uniref:hypothetical protein n=1 Tax=Hydrogenophaga sp. TaxID=1904254 RepID=UPI002731AAAA|nr:hypothetical protein [Hydrogenophaga sp.]MDP2165935.1 hypothetical protein [Hydrogenophaga sp.]
MKASNAMTTLQNAGLVLMLNPAGSLAVSPASRITPELRLVIKTNRDDLLAQLSHEASNDAGPHLPNPDRYCWPQSTAMNTVELDTFTARLARFTDKGMGLEDAERLADKLVGRDRESDGRRVCLECAHLQGHGRWRCSNWEKADTASQGLAPELVLALQRCSGYRHAA